MFDIAWSEMVLIGAVALVVIGPKDLPKALRTLGQAVGKVRRMATEFQGQFNDAMREAELDDLKKQVENVGEQVKSATEFDPIGQIRDDFDKPKSDTVSAEQATAKLAELPAPDMPPPVEIPAAPIADPAAKPKRPRKAKADAVIASEAAETSAAVEAPPPPEVTEEKPKRTRKAKVAEAEIVATEPEPEAVPAPKPPRKRKAKTVEPGEGSPA